jgi:hypothetical protein
MIATRRLAAPARAQRDRVLELEIMQTICGLGDYR